MSDQRALLNYGKLTADTLADLLVLIEVDADEEGILYDEL